MAPGRPRAVDYEYAREGTCTVWVFAEPLGGWRDVRVSGRRTAVDWAERMRALADTPRYADAERTAVVCDNPDTHDPGSLQQAFAPAEAKRITNRLDLVFTPKHGSWLNIAECELSVLTRQSLGPPRRRGCRHRPGRGMVPRAERRANRRQLALHHRRRADQAQEAVPQN